MLFDLRKIQQYSGSQKPVLEASTAGFEKTRRVSVIAALASFRHVEAKIYAGELIATGLFCGKVGCWCCLSVFFQN